MSIDAIINQVIPHGDDLILDLMAREVGGLRGQPTLTIKNATHTPVMGQQIWGGSDICIIEPGEGVQEKKQYRRSGYSLLEDFTST